MMPFFIGRPSLQHIQLKKPIAVMGQYPIEIVILIVNLN